MKAIRHLLDVEGKGYENVPLYYYVTDNLTLQIRREESMLGYWLEFWVRRIADMGRILQLVLLGVEGKRKILTWLLRLANDKVGWNNYPWGSYVWPTLYSQLKNANVKRWPKLYATQPTSEIEINSYSIFGYTWTFKTWILESFRVTATRYYYRYNRYPRVAAWKRKGKFLGSKGNLPAKRLTPDETEARSDWWISSRAYIDGRIGVAE
ncbi:hypothetical protein Tco_0471203 [Tanacetum coccineum]